MMRKTMFVVMLLLGITMVLAQEDHNREIEEGQKIVESKTRCDKLSAGELEAVGEYYMEQMHPGKTHELMDQMMGGEGSESLRQVHINMAKRLYCNEDVGGMMGGGMMNIMGSGMMGNYPIYYGYNNFWNIFWLFFLIGIIALIVWFIYKFTKRGKESETPISILQKRYAKGKINKKQFDEMKKELKE